MASGGNPIGEIPVLITGDFSDLEKSLQQATSEAASSASAIASAFNSAAGGIDPLTSQIQQVAEGFRTGSLAGVQFEQAMQGIYAQGANLSDVMAEVNRQTASLGSETQQAASGMQSMASSASQEASAAATAAQATQDLGSASASAAGGMQSFAQQAQQASAAATQGASEVEKMVTQLLAVAGISLSIGALKSFAETAVETFAEVEKVQIAFTYLSGSAETAAAAMADFKAVSQELALPFDSVTSFSQKLLAAGASLDQLDAVIRATADDAAATGTSFDSIATKIYNLAESTTIPTKSLKTLAITIQELADANGLTVQQLKDQWGSLTIDQKLEEIENGLRKFQGASKDVADSTSGDLERMKNSWSFTLEEVGSTLASVTKGLVPAFQYAGKIIAAVVTDIVDIFKGLGAAAAATFIALKDNFVTLGQVIYTATTQGLGPAIAVAEAGFKGFTDEIKHLYSDTVAEIKKDQSELENLGSTLSTGGPPRSGVTAGGSPPPGVVPAEAPDNSAAIKAAAALEKEFQRLMESSDKLIDETATDWNTYVDNLSHGGKTAESSVKAIQSDIENLQHALKDFAPGGQHDALQDEIDKLVQVRDRMNEIAASEDAAKITKQWNDAIQKIADENDKLSDAFDKMSDKAGMALTKTGSGFALTTSLGATLVGQVEVIPGLFDRIAASGNKTWADLNNALSITGITVDGARKKFAELLPSIDLVFTSQMKTLPEVEAEWAKYGAQIQKAAAQGVPEAIKTWNDYIAAITQLQGPIAGAIAQQQQLSAAINEGVLAGKQVGDLVFQYEKEAIAIKAATEAAKQMSQGQIIALANMNEAWQAHRDVVNLVSDVYANALKTLNQGFYDMGKAMADNLIAGKNLFEGLQNLVKNLAKQILEDLVGKAMKAFGESLIANFTAGTAQINTMSKSLDGLISKFGALFGGGGSSETAGGLGGGALPTTGHPGDFGGEFTGGGTTGGGGVGGALGTSTAGLIGLAVTAISDIVQGIQLAGLNNKLSDIRDHTLRIFNVLDQWHTQWFEHDQNMLNRIGELLQATQEGLGNIFTRLGDVWNTLTEIAAKGIAATAAGASGGGGSASSSPAGTSTVTENSSSPYNFAAVIESGAATAQNTGTSVNQLDGISQVALQSNQAIQAIQSSAAAIQTHTQAIAYDSTQALQGLDTSNTISLGTQTNTANTATATDATATNTMQMSDQLDAILQKLQYADKMYFLDKLTFLDKLDTLTLINASLQNGFSGLYSDNKTFYDRYGEILDHIKSIDANVAKIAGGITVSTVHSGPPVVTVPPLGNVIPTASAFPKLPTNAIFSASVPGSVANAGATPSIGSVDNSIGSITIHVNGAQSPRQTADAIFKELRNRSPKFSQATTRGN